MKTTAQKKYEKFCKEVTPDMKYQEWLAISGYKPTTAYAIKDWLGNYHVLEDGSELIGLSNPIEKYLELKDKGRTVDERYKLNELLAYWGTKKYYIYDCDTKLEYENIN